MTNPTGRTLRGGDHKSIRGSVDTKSRGGYCYTSALTGSTAYLALLPLTVYGPSRADLLYRFTGCARLGFSEAPRAKGVTQGRGGV